MFVSNHILSGALIGSYVANPAVAVVLSFMSHFVLDALPHFGYKTGGYEHSFSQPLTKVVVPFEVVAIALSIFCLLYTSPSPRDA